MLLLGFGIIEIAQILISLFLAILFLQSGVDKVTDWNGNLGWLKGHFANSPLKGIVPLMLGTITIIEIIAGLVSAVGALFIILQHDPRWAFYGLVLSTLSLVMLFFGQRLAKEYEGASTIAIYFALTLVGFVIFSL